MYLSVNRLLPPKSVRFWKHLLICCIFFTNFVNIMRNDSCQNTRNKTDDHAADPSAEFSPYCKMGVNTKEVTVGFTVLLIKLVSPNSSPSRAPVFGPIKRDARITGIWIIVALVNPSGIYPRKGVNAMITIITPKNCRLYHMPCAHTAACCLCFVCCLIHKLPPCYHSLSRYNTDWHRIFILSPY